MILSSYFHGSKRLTTFLLAFAVIVLLYIALPVPGAGNRWGALSLLESKPSHGQEQYRKRPSKPEIAIVVASRAKDDTSWLSSDTSSWQKYVYVVDDAMSDMTVQVNKGREAMVYLTYIIDHYETLHNITVFHHAERYQWHEDDPDYDGLRLLKQLRPAYIYSEGYSNLRCDWALGCPSSTHPFTDEATTPTEPTTGSVYKASFQQLFPGIRVPETVGAPCCAQFAVSADRIRGQDKAYYERLRQWLIETELADDLSGRILEYSWHIVFGKLAVTCPKAAECYCKLYGLCGMECRDDGACGDRYVLPTYATLPQGWPEIGWHGEERNVTVDP